MSDGARAESADVRDGARFDVVVVGAGLGGLVAGALLARAGRRVLLVERHVVAGGNATVFRRRGYVFDVGLHYVGGCGPDGALPRILRAAGAQGPAFVELDPEGYDELLLPGFEFAIPRGREVFRERLVAAFPSERRGIDRYARLLAELSRALATLHRPVALAGALLRSPALLRLRGATFAGYLDTITREPLLRAVLGAQHVGYALPPSRASVLVGAGITAHYLDGAYYPRGGGQAPADALTAALVAQGGTLELRTTVRRLLVEHGRVTGVELENRRRGVHAVRAPIVISNADLPRTVGELLPAGAAPARLADAARRWEMAPALAVAYLGLRRDLRAEGAPARNAWVAPALDVEPEYAAVARGEFPDACSAFITVASLKDRQDAALAPAGLSNVQIMAVAPADPRAWGSSARAAADGSYRREPGYLAAKAAFTERLLDAAARRWPDVRARVAHLELATPLTHSRYTLSTGGTSYGLAATPRQFLLGRPGARSGLPGLLLCGASTRTGHGIVGAATSGVHAAAAVLGRPLLRAVLG